MRVLIGCERSGIVRDEFSKLGHEAWSCDLVPSEKPGLHIVGDILEVIKQHWDLAIFHPPCTYLCSSGLHWNKKRPEREIETVLALAFVKRLMNADIYRICIENPTGRIGTAIRPADQYVQPYEFGDDASKKTGLWLKNLPTLIADPAKCFPPRAVRMPDKSYKPRWGNQTDSGQNREGPSDDRAVIRSQTYVGIARAMAEQWGVLEEEFVL